MHKSIADRLREEALKRNCALELSVSKPDPLMVASRYKDEYVALVCALFAYGNAQAIVHFLESLDFSLLETSESHIAEALQSSYYRFQSSLDIQAFFITLKRLKETHGSLEKLFLRGYRKKQNVMDGIAVLIDMLYASNPYRSKGYQFLLGKMPSSNPTSAYKRWHMYLRWMVRCDALDLGLWNEVRPQDLLMPLDTHTFRVGRKLGLIARKTYDFKAVLELTDALKTLDPNDPVKFDFALYRLGQEKQIL
ncbi:TIGR02757 family protein [Sulfurospirillum cavolei]|uniref:TIGR02757 family protein n=1 Tax=Sulfurospirillum cavolei TaxID=366522 RepID=UPI000764C764|nr:TIGR02757 family protein [Sulfurospirillum cavolei]